MATLCGETRDLITFKKGAVFISISPIEATSVENNRQYSIAYGSDYQTTVSFIVDMQGWQQLNHFYFEHLATTFTQVSLLSKWQDEVKYKVSPALVESIDWLHFILTSTRRNVIVELFATPVLLEDPRQNQFSRFSLLVSPEAAIAFGETLHSEITEARQRRIAQGFAKGDDGVITDDDDDEMATQYRIVTTEQEHKQLAPNVLRWFRAAFKGDIDTLNLLLESDIGLESTNAAGLTALHFAAAQGHAALVTRLIESGANIDAKTNTGLTAKNLAEINHNSEVVALFANIP